MHLCKKNSWILVRTLSFMDFLSPYSHPHILSSTVAMRNSSLTTMVAMKNSSLAAAGGNRTGLEYPKKHHSQRIVTI